MPSFIIDSFGFTNWRGQPPRLVNNHIRIFTKPGQNGISAQALGIYGDPFEVELHAVFADQATLTLAENAYRFLITAGPVIVVYNEVNYFTRFGHKYLVMNVTTTEQTRHPRLVCSLPAPDGYDYFGGWMLKSRWVLQPYT